MPPANQRLQANCQAGLQINLRLIVQLKLVIADGPLQGHAQDNAAQGGTVHVGPIKLIAFALRLFRLVHGGVGISNQLVGIVGVFREQGDADAGQKRGGIGTHHDWLRDAFNDLVGDRGG